MGVMRFRVFPAERITAAMVQQAYLAGADRIAWPLRASVEGDVLILQRTVSDTANLHIPWPVEGHGTLALTTANLVERDEPYWLPLELARGTIVQVRNQLADWQSIGLVVPEAVQASLSEAVEQFSWAAVDRADAQASAAHAEEALRKALDAGDGLALAYTDQSWAFRAAKRTQESDSPHLPLLAGDLGTILLDDTPARQCLRAFNAAEVPPGWRTTESTESHYSWGITDTQVEWCRAHGLRVIFGPLLMFDPQSLPDWLLLFEDDFESVFDCVSSFVRTTVRRYRGKVDYWLCAGRVNVAEALSLPEQERLQLVAQTIELVRSLDPDTPVLASFDQPWAESLRDKHADFPAIHFADTLVRAGADLSGLMIEMNVGCYPGGTLTRPVLEFSRQLDAWSRLGLPLWLSVSAPSGQHADPLAHRKAISPVGHWTPDLQQRWAARFIPLALAKPAVQGVVWNQLLDSRPHDFPHAGVFDAQGRPKPAMRTLAAIRQNYLK